MFYDPGCWTADFNMYMFEDGEPVLYFTPGGHNLIFRDISNAISQLRASKDYTPTKKGIEEVVAASETGEVLKVKLSDLRLKINGDRRYFKVNIKNIDSLNPVEKAFAERVYPQNYYKNFMGVHINVLSPDYVKAKLQGKGNNAIGRLSLLGPYSDLLPAVEFSSDDIYVDCPWGALFGVLKTSPRK